MPDNQPRPIRTGSDPRQLPDFIALSQELSKLTHPARPDVDWQKVENLALTLLEHNGVELQTAAWYTLAKTTTSSVNGMREGLALLSTLISHQWNVMWPPQLTARITIINGLSLRLQNVFRTLTLNGADLPVLYDCARRLSELGGALSRQAPQHTGQLEGVSRQVTQAIKRLESRPPQEEPEHYVADILTAGTPATTEAIPTTDTSSLPDTQSPELVYIVHHAPSVGVHVGSSPAEKPRTARWPVFVAGMALAFVLCGLTLTGYRYYAAEDPSSKALKSTVTPLPALLTAEQLGTLQHGKAPETLASGWLAAAGPLLNSLAAQPPDWNIRYGEQLLSQAQVLWPGDTRVSQLSRRWQQQLATDTMTDSSLKGWYQGMAQLNALSDRLNELDRQKGKYLTVSELKSQVFGMLTSFQQTIPLEEQLRQIKHLPADSPQRQQQMHQAEQHLRSQVYMLAQEKERD